MSRWKAAGIHLSISICVGLIVVALLFGVWYPPPYFHGAGADELVLLLVGVDLSLGPLLTLVVFKSGKKGLKFDLAAIALVQSVALVYGLAVVLESRPVFLVASVDRFVLVAANEIDDTDLARAGMPAYRSRSWTGPRLVGAKIPDDQKEREKILFSGIAGKDLDKYPEHYVDYAIVAPDILKHAKPLDALHLPDADARNLLAAATKNAAPDQIVWVPIVARKASLTMLLDRSSGRPVRAVAINPWD